VIPSALAGQLGRGLADFLRFSFWSSTPGMGRVIDDLLAQPGGLLKGPYLSLKLPFRPGSNPRFFPEVPLAFMPHEHQERAFGRLGGRRKLSTLVATGTGSGKTEAFLLPILDHCRAEAGTPGVKAILIYPMNALATDQAARIAATIHGNDRLRGRVSAGLYIGEDRGGAVGETAMGPTAVITDRATMQATPPDILLTNYKMLDYLLLRPRDQGIWQHNARGALRFLVVDEIHTFDGAQGTDLACLIRRLKRRLQVDDGSLCCVGTSATLGGSEAGDELRRYAGRVFGEPFDDHAVIGENRLGQAEYLAGCEREWIGEPSVGDLEALDPARAADPGAWLRTQVNLWFGDVHDADGDDAWAVALGERLKRHAAFQQLVGLVGDGAVDWQRVVSEMSRQRSGWRDEPALAGAALVSLVALISAARSWHDELPDVRTAREAAGRPRPVQPFVEARLQLWQRELRRMVATVGERPALRHSSDLDRDARRRHLPLVHCRECGAMGWATVVQRDTPHVYRTGLDEFYRAFFAKDARVQFLFPRGAVAEGDPGWSQDRVWLDPSNLTTATPGGGDGEPPVELIAADSIRSTVHGPELSRDCPFCLARESLSILGFRAATLTSVAIDQLFASRFNDDKKLLTFSDSVQDAAHRAGFFGARTWRTNVRIAMVRMIRERPGLTLAELSRGVGAWWRGQLDPATWVSTFLAPNMTWFHDWGALRELGELPEGSDLADRIDRRLRFEACMEFGLQAGIGRSLPRTGTATVAIAGDRLEAAVDLVLEPLRNEAPGLRGVARGVVRAFLVGLLHGLRTRGGILDAGLPTAFVETCGKDTHAFKRAHELPVFGRSSRLPALLTDRRRTARFDTWGGAGDASWYSRWVRRCFAGDGGLGPDAFSVFGIALPILVTTGVLRQVDGARGERIWGVSEDALMVTDQVTNVACQSCGHRLQVAVGEIERWAGVPCLTTRCPGAYAEDATPIQDYFGRLYAGGDLQRIFTEEHTGLLDRGERERVELEFKAREGRPDDPMARRPWFANLLSCTPTLEMGIDIGDLSSLVLCSVPPAQANYLQRIGRAGRRDGNALVLTVANERPHDLYFFAEPGEMIEGDVTPPGVFLDAPAVLERQLAAFCLDRWVAEQGTGAELPSQLRTVFSHLDDEDSNHFPFNWLDFVRALQPTVLREFGEMFAGEITTDTAEHLKAFLLGTDDGAAGLRWRVVDALHRERQQRDSLAAKARSLRKLGKQLEEAEARDKDHQQRIDDVESEKEALLALVQAINRRHTLEFLTDEGLLPNYAFPESAVRLRSVIWRKKKVAPTTGSRYDTWSYDFARSPSSALGEFAPNADFYAVGRRVRIDQVDMGAAEVEEWRFCPECSHCERTDVGDERSQCPACGSRSWADEGQKHRLLKLQQVFANAPDRESRIRDDQDERQPRFFQREMLVDVADEHRVGAWRIDDERVPFGFEYLKRAAFREVNFGEGADIGAKSLIAGREAVRPGFQVCARCGKVQRPGKDPEHALSCPSRKDASKSQIERCLYLYREFHSEALRILLPMADVSTTSRLHSFMAALQVGLRARFGGSVDHLHTTVYSDPVEGSNLRKQYLVLFDTVPGGTGYLKQLVIPEAEGGDMPLFQAMQASLDRIEGCRCWGDPDRDGCYRCILAYRNARDMDDTSARVASEVLRDILAGRDQLVQIASLGEISLSGLLDSVLEARFVEALRAIRGPDGAVAVLQPAVVRNKPGYRWACGDAEWLVEPQVEPPIAETGGVPVSIDFVMRPARSGDRRPLAVFLDGWEYHRDRIGKDLRQRMALRASGRWDVWSFTWADLDERLELGNDHPMTELAVVEPATVRSVLQRMGLPEFADLPDQPTFEWLVRELVGDGVPWRDLARGVLAARMAPGQFVDGDRWKAFLRKFAPPCAQPRLELIEPRMVGGADGDPVAVFTMMAVHDGDHTAVVCHLDDGEELWESADFKAAWRGLLRLFQLFGHIEDSWFVTSSGLADPAAYEPIEALRGGPAETAGWAVLGDIEPEFVELARALAARGVPEPEVGVDVPDPRGGAWAMAEMVWESRRFAVSTRADLDAALGLPSPGWTVVAIEDLGDDAVSRIAEVLEEEEI
jgi:DEAD/DEAH box helicase domain-containing protein